MNNKSENKNIRSRKNIYEAVKAILKESMKKDSMVYTSGSGAGLNLDHPKVKNAILRTMINTNKKD